FKKFKELLLKNIDTNTINFFFNNLSPTDEAENIEAYEQALDYALSDKNIKNIAITGPYGSGKTSFLKTYQVKRGLESELSHISLATFNEKDSIKKQDERDRLIEESILQQL